MALKLWSQADLIPDPSLTLWVSLVKSLNFSKPQFPPLKNGYSSCYLRQFLGTVNGITDIQCPVLCLIHRRSSPPNSFFPTAHHAASPPATEGTGFQTTGANSSCFAHKSLGLPVKKVKNG